MKSKIKKRASFAKNKSLSGVKRNGPVTGRLQLKALIAMRKTKANRVPFAIRTMGD